MPTESRGAAAWEGGVEVESDAASAEPGSGRCSPVSRRASDFSASISGKLAASEVLDALRGAGCSAASVSHRVADDPGISPFVARRSGWEDSDSQDGNLASWHWHHCRGVIVVQGGFGVLNVAARRSGVGRDCRVDRRSAATSLAFEGGAAAIAFDVHLEDGRVMDEAVDDSHGHCLIREDLAPFAKGLIGGDQQRSPLVAGADEFEEHAGFGLVLGDVGKVIEDQQVVFVELGNGGFESELAAGNLQSLDEIGGAGEQNAPAVFDQREAESCRKVALAP